MVVQIKLVVAAVVFRSVENWTESVTWIFVFLTPHKLNFELLMKTLKRKMKRNA